MAISPRSPLLRTSLIALVAFAAIPFGDRLVLGGRVIEFQVAKVDVALLYIFAMLSLGVYGVILAGFASRNNYGLLGGLRATAQMISYEIALGIAIIGLVMIFGTMDLQELVRGQGTYLAGGWIPRWGIVVQPVAFFVFVTVAFIAASVASLYRLPTPPESAFRTPWRRVTPACFVALSALLLVLLVLGRPKQALLGLVVVALGLPVYAALRRRGMLTSEGT